MQKCCRLDKRHTDKGDKNKEQTIAYVDDLEEAEKMSIENGYGCIILEEN